MENLFGNYFLGKSHFSYIENVFGSNFAIISDWRVVRGYLNVTERAIRCPFMEAFFGHIFLTV